MYLRVTLAETLLRAGIRERAYSTLKHATNTLRARAAEMNDAAMEAAFMLIPVHRRLFQLLATLSQGVVVDKNISPTPTSTVVVLPANVILPS